MYIKKYGLWGNIPAAHCSTFCAAAGFHVNMPLCENGLLAEKDGVIYKGHKKTNLLKNRHYHACTQKRDVSARLRLLFDQLKKTLKNRGFTFGMVIAS